MVSCSADLTYLTTARLSFSTILSILHTSVCRPMKAKAIPKGIHLLFLTKKTPEPESPSSKNLLFPVSSTLKIFLRRTLSLSLTICFPLKFPQ